MNLERLNTVSSNHLLIQIKILKLPCVQEYQVVYMTGNPVGLPIAYANKQFLNDLRIYSDVVRLYPENPQNELFQKYHTFFLRKTETQFLDIFEDKKTKSMLANQAFGTSHEWFKKNGILENSMEAQIEVVPEFNVKPMY